MTTVTIYSVNDSGLNEIAEFLGREHRLGRDHFASSMLRAWADDAEFQLSEGNPASIEIRACDARGGATIEYTISPAGLTAETVEIDE